ncbi:hypothetical protein M413DRAFT_126557 [Hebeloma cylindrosporum]|uniref:Prolyl 4-hydroxylase alpha subunit Fe(2+) 2OG dioxygenase domain-containing protein n=1 Tax=Hebeloma cylindrosporum TaxID=76867 RepID=A0A0C2XWV1_HEBCY|nr:hypothetical protein M413DRAFT_126557 [Hebeloma cylindrosporum h7]
MDPPETVPRPLVASQSEAYIASQLLPMGGADSEMSGLAAGSDVQPGPWKVYAEEDLVSKLLVDNDSEMVDAESQMGPAKEEETQPTNLRQTPPELGDTAENATISISKDSIEQTATDLPSELEIHVLAVGQNNDISIQSTTISTETLGIASEVNVHASRSNQGATSKDAYGENVGTSSKMTISTTREEIEPLHDEGADDDDDMSSELSEGGDLQEELLDALKDRELSFQGSYYHSSLLTTAPNPCLYISGLGVIGLPLSERDARAIISCANLAPFGHGERTVVDKDVRDTWEIEPARLSFTHPRWEAFIQNTVCTEVCKSLGVSMGNNPPRMELYKLLLYERGSHFLPHQDTQKADGMFATVVVVLPSAYTGGQVVVSHASTSRTIDFSEDSLHGTSILAWYTDVRHEVKPAISGYRLALSYNLIHVAPPNIPRPSLPDTSSSADSLRHILRKWQAEKYKTKSEQRFVAYLLDHEYSPHELEQGSISLKGADARRVALLQPIAEDLGFILGLASLEHYVSGCADDSGSRYHNRRRWDYDEEEEKTPSMLEVTEKSTKISGLVDLDGDALLSVGEIELEKHSIIPKNPFKNATPDDTEYEGYMGNGAGQLDYWYRRTVLVILHEDDVDDICYYVEGVPYAYQKLKDSCTIPPTSEDRLWASRLLQKIRSLTPEHIKTLLEYALKWKDLEIWKGLMKSSSCSLGGVPLDLFLNAWKTFTFEAVCVGFEEILARSTKLPERMNLIYSLPSNATGDEIPVVRAWCRKESDKVLSAYKAADINDIPTILSIIRVAGLEAFIRVMKPNLPTKTGSYSFWLALRRSLKDGKAAILEREAKVHNPAAPPSQTPTDGIAEVGSVSNPQNARPAVNAGKIIDDLMKECLEIAALQWSDAAVSYMAPSHSYYHAQNTNAQAQSCTVKINRIIEIIELAIHSGQMDVCRTLFADILRSPGTSGNKVATLYSPLIPRLRTLLTMLNQDLCSPPFVDLMQVIVATYLKDVLGGRGAFNCLLRKVGCGCMDCQPLDKFLLDPSVSNATFRLVQNRRLHLETRLSSANDLCTFQTIRSGSPHGLMVTKRPEVVLASSWNTRQKDAKAFLASIGTDDVISRIMGPRYPDVTQALNGVKAFASGLATPAASGISHFTPATHAVPASRAAAATTIPPGTATATNRFPQAAASSSSSPNNARQTLPAAPSRTTAGQKRKNSPIILGPVIDLTEDDT